MTSSYMALHADDFEPFLEMSLDEYRQTRIDPTNQEIDQIGLQALTTGVIAPAGIGLEVLYLDRSAGDAVTPHAFVDDAQDKPNVRLLYRPYVKDHFADKNANGFSGHYDIIYKNNSPLTVMLNWDSQVVRSDGDSFEQHNVADMYSYMFPYSAYRPDPFPNQSQPSDTSQHQRSQSQQVLYDHTPNTTDFHHFPAPTAYASQPMFLTQSYQPPPTQTEYFNLPKQTYAGSNSTSSVSVSPLQPPPQPPVPTVTEPQIRLSANMFRHDHGPYVAVPLDPRQVGRYALPFPCQ